MESSTFQKVVLTLCFLLAVGAVIVFATLRSNSSGSIGHTVMWGTVEPSAIARIIAGLNYGKRVIDLEYTQVPEDQMVEELTEALATGGGPDIVMLNETQIVQLQDKLTRIPFDVLSEREFKDTFVEEGELFLANDGVVAIPFTIDPLIMYWNRDLFTFAGVSRPPEYWDELPAAVQKLVKVDGSRTITQAAIALGEYQNVAHAKQILAATILQAGNPIVEWHLDTEGKVRYLSLLTERYNNALIPADAALDFYVQFADPSRDTYTWNRSLRNSTDAFISGDLAMYFGFASELRTMRQKNPNINYDVAPFIQARDGLGKKTYARLSALAVTKTSKDPNGAYQAIRLLTSQDSIKELLTGDVLPPVRRDMLATAPGDAYSPIFYAAALAGRGFLDPDSEATETIFKNAIESVISGRARTGEALSRANSEMTLLLQ